MLGTAQGTAEYLGKSHRNLVRKKGMTDEHFDAAMECLQAALDTYKVSKSVSSQIMDAAISLKSAVLTGK